jgi:hypothetical protein
MAFDAQNFSPSQEMTCSGRRFTGKASFGIVPGLYFDGIPPWTLEAIIIRERMESDFTEPDMNLIAWTEMGGVSLCTLRSTHWAFHVGLELDKTRTYVYAVAKTPTPLHERQHVAGVWDGQWARLYIDGKLQSTVSADASRVRKTLTGNPMTIGADPMQASDAREFFAGVIESIRVSRSVLYEDDFHPPRELGPVDESIAVYDFRYDEGNYAYDRSGNASHAILVNTKPIPRNQ